MNAIDVINEAIPHLDGALTYAEVASVETCREVFSEVRRAMMLHKGMNSLHEAYAVILEEVDEFWEQVKVNPKKLSYNEQAVRVSEMRKELIQIAAMCVRAIVDTGIAEPAVK